MKNVTIGEFHEELRFNKESDAVLAHQRRLLSKVSHLDHVKTSDISYEYSLAQAKYICELYADIKLLPFKSLYAHFLAMTTKDKFQTDHHVIFNDYGMLEINHESLSKLKPLKISFDSI